MKAYFFLLLGAMAATAFTSCSEDEVVAVNSGHPIEFHTDMLSRGTMNTTANLSEFYVYAYTDGGQEVMPKTLFTKDAASGNFVSEKKYYWPAEGTVKFLAYTSYGSEEPTLSPDDQKLTVIAGQHPEQSFDFITAKASGTKKDNEKTGVELTFEHRFAQVEIKVLSRNKDFEIEVGRGWIGPLMRWKSIYDFLANTWTSTNLTGSYNFNSLPYVVNNETITGLGHSVKVNETAQTLTDNGTNGRNLLIVPGQDIKAWDVANDKTNTKQGGFIALVLNVKKDGKPYFNQEDYDVDVTKSFINISDGSQGIVSMIPLAHKYEAGKKYVITIDLTDGLGYWRHDTPELGGDPLLGNPITITSVEVTDWVNTTNQTLTPNK
ncbi:MAG: fimbrillin family protein [Bacteroides sp.]|nr:fimbrillin family protein [Bacteroides sp.]